MSSVHAFGYENASERKRGNKKERANEYKSRAGEKEADPADEGESERARERASTRERPRDQESAGARAVIEGWNVTENLTTGEEK